MRTGLEARMHEVLTSGALRAADAKALRHRVLTLPGDLAHEHLLQLARCSVPRDRQLELYTLDGIDGTVRAGAPGPQDQLANYGPERVSSVLRAVHEIPADALVLGYPGHARGRSHFTDVVERATAAADLDVFVCVERHDRPWRRVLVPYLYGPLDSAALGVARRLTRCGQAEVTVLDVVDSAGAEEDSAALQAAVGGCTLKVVTADDPVTAAADEARCGYDVIVLGGRQPRPGRGRYFTMRQQRLLLATDASLVIAHAARPAVH
jgi:hypothetical protein